jgi:hypothetical protein
MTSSGFLSNWNAARALPLRLTNCHEIRLGKIEDLKDTLIASYEKLESGQADITAIYLPEYFVESDAFSFELEKVINASLEGKPAPFCELRNSSKKENINWHIHLIGKLRPDVKERKQLTFGDVGWNARAFTLNVAVKGESTQFTSPANIRYDTIDMDFDLEEDAQNCSLGNLQGADVLNPAHVFQPPLGTIMIFRDNVIHRAPALDSERKYVIAGNVPFDVEYEPQHPDHSPLPTDILNRCRLFPQH